MRYEIISWDPRQPAVERVHQFAELRDAKNWAESWSRSVAGGVAKFRAIDERRGGKRDAGARRRTPGKESNGKMG